MSTGYGWECLRHVCAMLLGAHHVPGCLRGGIVYMGRYNKCSPVLFWPTVVIDFLQSKLVVIGIIVVGNHDD